MFLELYIAKAHCNSKSQDYKAKKLRKVGEEDDRFQFEYKSSLGKQFRDSFSKKKKKGRSKKADNCRRRESGKFYFGYVFLSALKKILWPYFLKIFWP